MVYTHFKISYLALIVLNACVGFNPASASPNFNNAISAMDQQKQTSSLEPNVNDFPSTFTFRSSCIKKTYVDGFYQKQLNQPTLVKNGNGSYTLYATCLNGLGVPTETKINLKLIIRYAGDIRTISIQSIIDSSQRYRNCADIANTNGVLRCIPATLPDTTDQS